MADVLAKVQEMKAMFADIEAELQASQSAPAADDSAEIAELQGELKKAQDAADAVVKERDSLRAIIQVEIDDKKKDTSRLEAALAPVEVAPAPVVPQMDDPAPAAPAEAAPSQAPAADQPAPAAEPSADASPAGVSMDSPS